MAVSTENWRNAVLTIANGATESDELDLAKNGARRQIAASLHAPTTLPDTVTIQLAEKTGGTYQTLQSGGVDINPTAGKITVLEPIVAGALKLVAASAVSAARAFRFQGVAKA